MALYPAFLDLKERPCLVIGSGRQATRRARSLEKSGAFVTSMKGDDNDAYWAGSNGQREIEQLSLDKFWLIVAATDSEAVNQQIAKLCESARVFCNVTTASSNGSFFTPSVVDRSPLMIAISTGGESPVLSRVLKARLESLFPSGYARLAAAIANQQRRVREAIPDRVTRATFWHGIVNGSVGELAFGKPVDNLDQRIEQALTDSLQTDSAVVRSPLVSLVGAGPGDPDLLTFRALRLIQSADVIVYDRLVNSQILELAPDDTEMIYAGKARSQHAIPQESINTLLVKLAQSGKNVVRLKGGDPFIFGRGGEEIETLAEAGLPFQVVPGITAASGCSAFSGIPLTHRDHAQSCVFVTGHLKNNEVNLNWEYLRDPEQTIVVYMSLVGLSMICEKLIEHGRDRTTPAALIEQGTTPQQRVFKADLGSLASLIENAGVKAPTLLIVGQVVTLHDSLNWFSSAGPGNEI